MILYKEIFFIYKNSYIKIFYFILKSQIKELQECKNFFFLLVENININL